VAQRPGAEGAKSGATPPPDRVQRPLAPRL